MHSLLKLELWYASFEQPAPVSVAAGTPLSAILAILKAIRSRRSGCSAAACKQHVTTFRQQTYCSRPWPCLSPYRSAMLDCNPHHAILTLPTKHHVDMT